jgi:type VI protein secretion system component Hcp
MSLNESHHAIWTAEFDSIPGSSMVKGAEGQLDLLDARFQAHNTDRSPSGGHMRGPGSTAYSDVSVVRLKCAASTVLVQYGNTGKEIPSIKIHQYSIDGQNQPVITETWTLTKNYIVNFQKAVAGNPEMFEIRWTKMMVEEFVQDLESGVLKPSGTWGYDRYTREAF